MVVANVMAPVLLVWIWFGIKITEYNDKDKKK